MEQLIKKLDKLETRADKLAETIARCRQELEYLLYDAEDVCDKIGDNPNAQAVLEHIRTVEREVSSVDFESSRSKLDVDEHVARILENQWRFLRQKEAEGKPTEGAESRFAGMHDILDAVATWRRDDEGRYWVVTR